MHIGSVKMPQGYDAAAPGSGHSGAGPAADEARLREAGSAAGADKAAGKEPAEEKNVVTMMAEALEKSDSQLFWQTKTTTSGGIMAQKDKPKDSSAQLTSRLVGAKGQFEVRQVIAKASSDLVQLRMAAATLKGAEAEKVRGYIRRLEKLISRAGTKIKELDKEDMLEIQKARAQKKQQARRVEEIKAELRKKRVGRGARENGYLIEGLHDSVFGRQQDDEYQGDLIHMPSEAQIAAKAEAIAAAEGFADIGGAVEAAGPAEGPVPGGGAEASAGAPADGGVDISL